MRGANGYWKLETPRPPTRSCHPPSTPQDPYPNLSSSFPDLPKPRIGHTQPTVREQSHLWVQLRVSSPPPNWRAGQRKDPEGQWGPLPHVATREARKLVSCLSASKIKPGPVEKKGKQILVGCPGSWPSRDQEQGSQGGAAPLAGAVWSWDGSCMR